MVDRSAETTEVSSDKISSVLEGIGERISNDSENILRKIKWQLSYTKKNTDKPFGPKGTEDLLDGLLRGDFAERYGEKLPINMCETVYSSGTKKKATRIITFQKLTGQKTKEHILAAVVIKSLREVPLKNIRKHIKNDKEKKKNLEKIRQEIIAGYSDKKFGSRGLFYADTVIPDSALKNIKGEVVGFMEVKAYLPGEMEALIKHLEKKKDQGDPYTPYDKVRVAKSGKEVSLSLGVNVDGEVEFVDNFRSAGFGLEPLRENTEILLRFPKDVPDELLKSYGEILNKLHYRNITIQKLPLTSTKLTEMAKKFIKDNLEQIKNEGQKLKFSKREINILEKYTSEV